MWGWNTSLGVRVSLNDLPRFWLMRMLKVCTKTLALVYEGYICELPLTFPP